MASKDKDLLVQFAGQLETVATKLRKALERRASTIVEAIAFLASEEGDAAVEKIVDLVVAAKQTAGHFFRFIVDYAMSVEEMVTAGRYDRVNSDISSEHFPHDRGRGRSEVGAELVHLNRYFASGDEVLRELDRRGYRPANLAEGLAFGAAYPDEQRKYPIAILGSVWRNPYGRQVVAYLAGGAGGRELRLGWLVNDWREYWRFLAFRK